MLKENVEKLRETEFSRKNSVSVALCPNMGENRKNALNLLLHTVAEVVIIKQVKIAITAVYSKGGIYGYCMFRLLPDA